METPGNDQGERLEGAGGQPDTRCSGDHPGDWGREAVPGSGFCQECLDRLAGPVRPGRVVYSGGPWPEAEWRGGELERADGGGELEVGR
jgi:hypothetical protein